MIDIGQATKIVPDEGAAKAAERVLSIQYLQSTDWQVIAKYERKRPIPDDVKVKRKAALDIVTAEPVTET